MKPMSGSNNNSNNWLGFSLFTHMNMEVPAEPHHHQDHASHHRQTQPAAAAASSAVPCSIFLSPQVNNSRICYGMEGPNGGLYSQLSVMPLKSDGSLCIMEALSRSQQQGLPNALRIYIVSSRKHSKNACHGSYSYLNAMKHWCHLHHQSWRTFLAADHTWGSITSLGTMAGQQWR